MKEEQKIDSLGLPSKLLVQDQLYPHLQNFARHVWIAAPGLAEDFERVHISKDLTQQSFSFPNPQGPLQAQNVPDQQKAWKEEPFLPFLKDPVI